MARTNQDNFTFVFGCGRGTGETENEVVSRTRSLTLDEIIGNGDLIKRLQQYPLSSLRPGIWAEAARRVSGDGEEELKAALFEAALVRSWNGDRMFRGIMFRGAGINENVIEAAENPLKAREYLEETLPFYRQKLISRIGQEAFDNEALSRQACYVYQENILACEILSAFDQEGEFAIRVLFGEEYDYLLARRFGGADIFSSFDIQTKKRICKLYVEQDDPEFFLTLLMSAIGKSEESLYQRVLRKIHCKHLKLNRSSTENSWKAEV